MLRSGFQHLIDDGKLFAGLIGQAQRTGDAA